MEQVLKELPRGIIPHSKGFLFQEMTFRKTRTFFKTAFPVEAMPLHPTPNWPDKLGQLPPQNSTWLFTGSSKPGISWDHCGPEVSSLGDECPTYHWLSAVGQWFERVITGDGRREPGDKAHSTGRCVMAAVIGLPPYWVHYFCCFFMNVLFPPF